MRGADFLTDTKAVLRWADTHGFGSEADRLHVLAVACRALRLGDHPYAFFAALTAKRDWSKISLADEDEASRRMSELRRRPQVHEEYG
ncbi:MAG: hypothetical protein HYS13_07500 [Planctomycetia bacterium]|nr:hypothetical protein [Planctomycetia bacterium]